MNNLYLLPAGQICVVHGRSTWAPVGAGPVVAHGVDPTGVLPDSWARVYVNFGTQGVSWYIPLEEDDDLSPVEYAKIVILAVGIDKYYTDYVNVKIGKEASVTIATADLFEEKVEYTTNGGRGFTDVVALGKYIAACADSVTVSCKKYKGFKN